MNQTLRELELFQELNDKEVQYLASISVLRSYDKDSIVFYNGEESLYLHVLIEGSVKIYKSTQKNNEITLKKITHPSLIAELSNFKHIRYPSNCATLSDSKILLVDYQKFEEIILQNSSYLRRFMDSMTESLVDLNRVVGTFTLDATAKVAKYIFESEEDFKKNTFIQSATLLNMTPETFSRSIKKLKDEGALFDKETVDKEKLKHYF